eukprot:TRINITY_DN17202_c0_g1_i2.p1 TRINITY_DN17202_c0_g1~~TRINITY_DN17202_c0_g1_i2.p1  ORF type:complete len:377 (+),score=97.88 TRINITY_DN17202_c0_g1_i2:195-1325(+)
MCIRDRSTQSTGNGSPISMELREYAARYAGHAKVSRMIHLANNFEELRTEAAQLAASALLEGCDVARYERLCNDQRFGLVPDTEWLERTRKQSDVLQGKMEARLADAKASNVPQKIMEGLVALGDFWFERGVFDGAENKGARACYMQARDYSTTSCQSQEWCVKLTRSYTMMAEDDPRHFQRALNFASQAKTRAREAGSVDMEEEFHVVQVLFHLHNLKTPGSKSGVKRQQSAQKILGYVGHGLVELNFNKFTKLEHPVICVQDVALLGGLSALMSFSRKDLKTLVMENQNFQRFLGRAPKVQAVVGHFFNRRYVELFKLLQELSTTWIAYDMYIAPHSQTFYDGIRGWMRWRTSLSAKCRVEAWKAASIHTIRYT